MTWSPTMGGLLNKLLVFWLHILCTYNLICIVLMDFSHIFWPFSSIWSILKPFMNPYLILCVHSVIFSCTVLPNGHRNCGADSFIIVCVPFFSSVCWIQLFFSCRDVCWNFCYCFSLFIIFVIDFRYGELAKSQ